MHIVLFEMPCNTEELEISTRKK